LTASSGIIGSGGLRSASSDHDDVNQNQRDIAPVNDDSRPADLDALFERAKAEYPNHTDFKYAGENIGARGPDGRRVQIPLRNLRARIRRERGENPPHGNRPDYPTGRAAIVGKPA
jgi:hypothetical protein